MAGVVTFGTKYGTTEAYARALAAQLGFDCINSKQLTVQNSKAYSVWVHGGGLYASGVAGLGNVVKALEASPATKLFVFTVGLADPQEESNIQSIRAGLQQKLPQGLYNGENIFHLRGGMDYSKLTFLHKTALKLVYKEAAKTPPAQHTAAHTAIVETYGKAVDFTNLATLAPLAQRVQAATQ